MGHSVCKLAGLQAHIDHQSPNRVVLHWKTAYVGQANLAYIPNYLIVSILFFALIFVCYKDSIPLKSCDLEWWVACCDDFVVKSVVHAAGNQTCAPLLAVFELRCF